MPEPTDPEKVAEYAERLRAEREPPLDELEAERGRPVPPKPLPAARRAR